ncbi:MAG: hypothetical protein HY692_04180, partial [Cyanobacteria bacterium NC_groundwater_1444_Ag_S-0.65um_54_12]|nr:hypothetical protein [Cyanobacteria bacterium NC_groundwater_1444_Ag_S-0.65um_54_12]
MRSIFHIVLASFMLAGCYQSIPLAKSPDITGNKSNSQQLLSRAGADSQAAVSTKLPETKLAAANSPAAPQTAELTAPPVVNPWGPLPAEPQTAEDLGAAMQ